MTDTVRRRAAFAMLPEWVIRADISSHAVRLYAALDRFAGLPQGAIPSRKTLANEWLHCHVSTVDRAKIELVEIGALTIEQRPNSSNLYTLEDQPPPIHPRIGDIATGDDIPYSPVSTEREGFERELGKETPPVGEASLAVAVSNGVQEIGAQQLVAAYCDAVSASGTAPPRRLVGMVARQVGELVDDGVAPEVVGRALGLMLERRLHPSTLATLVPEAASGPRQQKRFGRGLTTDQMLQGAAVGQNFSPAMDAILRGGRR